MFESLKRFLASLAIVSIAISPYSPLLLVAHADQSGVTIFTATGGTAIPASTAGGAWTNLTGPTLAENNDGEIGSDDENRTLTLNLPTGFQFDTTGTAPTVLVTRISGSGNNNCNINNVASGTALSTTRTATTVSVVITDETSCNVRNSLTWQNLRVRPITASPLRSGNITMTGHEWVIGVQQNTSLGILTMVASVGTPSLANSLVSVTPTSTVVGTNATITVTLKDASNNPVSGYSAGNIQITATGATSTITKLASSTNASGTLQATITSTVAETKTITVTTLGVGGGTLSNTATVTFVADAPAKADIAASATSSVVGNPVTLTINLKDQYDNVVVDGSTATLTTTLGQTGGAGTTTGGVLTRTVNSTTTGNATLGFSSLVAPMTVTGVTNILFTPDVPAVLTITTQPSSTASVDSNFTTQPVVTVKDQYGNNVADDTIVSASLATGTGTLRNVSTVTTAGVATYGTVPTTELGYSKSDEVFTIRFSAGSANAVSDPLGPLAHGVITKLKPVASPTSLIEGTTSTITVYGQDQFGNTVTDNNTATGAFLVTNFGSIDPLTFTLSGGIATAGLTRQTYGTVNVTTISTPPTNLLGDSVEVEFTKADTVAPTFESSIPTYNATGVAITTPLSLTFSEVLKASTVTSANVYLVNASTSATVPATVSLVEGGKTIQITPSTPLDYATQYYFEATSGITDLEDNALSATAVSSSTTGFTTAENTADVTAPIVESQYPDVSATNVAISVVPTVTFSESMKASTITGTSIGIKKVSDDSVIPATITLAGAGTQAVITPNSALENNTAYYIFVTTDVTDEAGNALATNYGGSEASVFTTAPVVVEADETAPIISGIAVTDITTSSVRIVWNTNEPADSQVEFGLTDAYGSMTSLDTATTTAHSVIITGLLSNQIYHFRVLSADESGNQATSGDNTFATAFDDSAELHVTSIALVKSFAIADDTFANGWRWIFDVTVPTIEQNVSMKFSDFVGSASNTIPAANNIRFYSTESSNAQDATSSITITAPDTYFGVLHMTSDRSSTTPGRQVQIVVEAKVPTGTPADSYSASYGIKSEPVEEEIVID